MSCNSTAWPLCKWRLGRCAILEHHRNAVLNRVVAATTIAMQPCMRGAIRTDGKRVVAYRANQDFEQSLGEHRAHHLMSLDGSWASDLELVNTLGHLP
jgi:hypothetical protein